MYVDDACITDEVGNVVSVAEPSGGLASGVVDAVVRMVGAGRVPNLPTSQVIVVVIL